MSNSGSHVHSACVKVIGKTQEMCPSTFPSTTPPVAVLPATVKIPVVLSTLQVQINVDAFIKLPEPALEIKKIKKRLKVTQCLLMQEPPLVGVVPATTGTLFLKGFVRKNIEYATRGCSNLAGVCGDIRHCTVDVPFSCTTNVPFNGSFPFTPIANTTDEFEYYRKQKLPHDGNFAEKDHLLSGDFSEFNQVSQEFFTELPFCELISARIVEYDEFLNRNQPCVPIPFEEKEFTKIEEKMIISLVLKVLQNQDVLIGT